MKHRQRVQKSDVAPGAVDDESPKHRLTGISVNEISIVDRAANKRKYLVVKRDGVLHVEKDFPPPHGGPQQQAPAPPVPPTAPAPPTLRISPELKTKVIGILKTAQERIGVIAKVVEGSSETPGAAPPQELMDALSQLAQLFAPAAAPPAQPTAAAPAAAAPPAGPPAMKDATEKAGRKLSAARLAQLNSVRATLDALISDVSAAEREEAEAASSADDDGEQPAKKAETQTTPDATPAGEPPGGDRPSNPEKKQDEEKKPAVGTSPSQDVTELKQSVAGVVDSLAKMTQLFEAQNQRFDTLAKSRGASQQADLDSPVIKKQERVVWELDMASPMKTIQ